MKLNQTQKLLLGVVAGMMVLVLVLSLFLFQTGTGNPTATTAPQSMQGTTGQPTTGATDPSSTDPTTVPGTTAGTEPSTPVQTDPTPTQPQPTTPPQTDPAPTEPNLSTGAFKLVENGQPMATIVISRNYTEKTLAAAWDLQTHLQKMSGATVAIGYDDVERGSDRFYILVGPSKYTEKLGVQQPKGYPNNEKFIIKRIANVESYTHDGRRNIWTRKGVFH